MMTPDHHHMRLLKGLEGSRSAVLSECGTYRYVLTRAVQSRGVGTVNFVMLNPSTADASVDDPTVRRCLGYARDWGYGHLVITNLFAFRSTDPRTLIRAEDPIGPENDRHLLMEATAADLVVCGWGERGGLHERAAVVLKLLSRVEVPHCLAMTKSGQPGHPLYLPANLRPVAMKLA